MYPIRVGGTHRDHFVLWPKHPFFIESRHKLKQKGQLNSESWWPPLWYLLSAAGVLGFVEPANAKKVCAVLYHPIMDSIFRSLLY